MAERTGSGSVLGPPSGRLLPDVGRVIASGIRDLSPGDVAAALPGSGLWMFQPGKPTIRMLLAPASAHIPMICRMSSHSADCSDRWAAMQGWAICQPILDPQDARLLPPSAAARSPLCRVLSGAGLDGRVVVSPDPSDRVSLRFATAAGLPEGAFVVPADKILATLESKEPQT